MRNAAKNAAKGVLGLALVSTSLMPGSARAQTGASGAPTPSVGQALSPAEEETYEMGLQMAFACSPRRHNQAARSESIIEGASAPMVGTAVFFRGIEGTFLALEQYDDELDGHCLVLGWFGGPLEPGRYEIHRLAMSTVEAQAETGTHTFFSMSAVRKSAEMSVLATESGTVEIATVEPGRITGSFDLTGFVIEGSSRGGDVAWKGSFDAMEGEA